MVSPKRKLLSSFASLNLTQFFTALNDNLYKLILVFFLIHLLGTDKSNAILATAGAIFVIPFLVFASFAGSISDRYSKRAVIYFTRIFEIIATILGILAFYFESVIGGYVVLFLLALQSTIFSPAKYGIIVEITPREKVSHCNGILTATTYLAIILGTFFASFLSDMTRKDFVLAVSFCLLIALLGALSSLWIDKTPAQAAKKKVSVRFIRDIFRSLKKARQRRYLLTVILFGAYFLFLGAFTQLNIIPMTLQSLGMSEVQGGYLFLMTALGIGIGSFFAGRFSRNEVELGFVPLASLGASLCFLGIFFFASHFFAVVFFLILLGICGGFYIIPLEVFIQVASPDEDRGQNVATANFLNFIGVIAASGLLALVGSALELSAATGFFVLGLMTFLVSVTLFILFADQVFRFASSLIAWVFWDLRVVGKKRLKMSDPIVLVGQKSSWLDTIVMMATLPRLIRYIIPIEKKTKRHKYFYDFLWLIPMDHKHVSTIGPETFAIIKKELECGHSICLMHPTNLPPKTLLQWRSYLEENLQNIDVPIVPIHILRKTPEKTNGRFAQLRSLFEYPVRVAFGTQIDSHTIYQK
ncbi:MAG: MFS transporter [Chlamydiales bacterium]